MIGELRGDRVSQQTRAAQSSGNRPDIEWPGGLNVLFLAWLGPVAVSASVALLDGADHEELDGFQIELFRRLLTDALAELTAAGTEFLGIGEVVNDFTTFEVFGQLRATVFITTRWRLLGNRHWRWCATFASTTETVLQGSIEFGFEFGILSFEFFDSGEELAFQFLAFDEELPDDPVKSGNIGWQRRIDSQSGGIHAPSNTPDELR